MDPTRSCPVNSDECFKLVSYDETRSNSSLDDFLDDELEEESYQRNVFQNNQNNNNAQSNRSAETDPPSYSAIVTPSPLPSSTPRPTSHEQQQAQTNYDMLSQILNELKDVRLELGNNQGELKQVKLQMEQVKEQMNQVKLQMVKRFIQELVSTKEFAKSLQAALDSEGKPELNKFMNEIEASEVRGLGALIKKLQREHDLSNEDLIEIVNDALLVNPEIAKKVGWSKWAEGLLSGDGVGEGLLIGGGIALAIVAVVVLAMRML